MRAWGIKTLKSLTWLSLFLPYFLNSSPRSSWYTPSSLLSQALLHLLLSLFSKFSSRSTQGSSLASTSIKTWLRYSLLSVSEIASSSPTHQDCLSPGLAQLFYSTSHWIFIYVLFKCVLSIFPFGFPRIWETRNECGKKKQWIRMTPNIHIKWEDFHVHRPIKGMASHNRKSCCFERLAVSLIFVYIFKMQD